MLNSLQEIQNNGVVNRFKETAESYGLYGVYINWKPGGLNNDHIYFVCGLDKNKVLNENIDMHQVIENQNKSKGYVPIDVVAFPLTNEYPFMAHYKIIEYCHKIDAVQKVYNHFNKKIPTKLPASLIKTLEMTWRNFTNEKKTPELRREYEKILEYAIKTEELVFDKNNPNYRKEQYILNGYYDTGKNKIYNWFKMHFARYKNKVSAAHLLTQEGSVHRAEILYRDYRAIKKALNSRPDILYSFSPVHGEVLKVEDGEGFGSKQKNDRRSYTLYYSSVNAKDVEEMLQKHNYPTEFNKTLDDIDPSNHGTEHIIVPIDYFNMFKNNCEKSCVNFCIDRSFYSTVGDGIAIAFSSKDGEKVYDILNGILKASENFHLKEALPNNFIENCNYENYQVTDTPSNAKGRSSSRSSIDKDDECR